MSQSFNNLIKFPVTQEFIDYWGNTSISDRLENNYLDLRVSRNDYTLVTEGKGVTTKRGYSNVYGSKERKRIGFRLRVRSQSEDLYLAMLDLANYTAGDGCNLQPIEILDYCHRHDKTDREQGYRLRRGVFEGEFSQVKGTVTQGYVDCQGNENVMGNRYGSGFTFKFMETEVLAGYF